MSDTGVPMMNGSPTVHGTFRTFPIRVANRPEAGMERPSYHDSAEITFESIGQQQELTTVTKLPRRLYLESAASDGSLLSEQYSGRLPELCPIPHSVQTPG